MKRQSYFIMGLSLLIVGTMSLSLVSCEQNAEILGDYQKTPETVSNTRTVPMNDSICLFSNVDSLLKPQTRAYSYYPQTDEYYSSNMWAIRELPFALKVRGGSNDLYFTTQGINKELCLTQSNNSKFYLKILPSSTGIPYLIYSDYYKKPLVCGQYASNPDNKLVVVWDQENATTGSWDLIPSSYRGYFAIENQTYFGTEDPNNPWGVYFNYAIEAKNERQLGYAKYTKQPQQEFLLDFVDSFNVKEIEFDSKSAIVTQLEPVEIESNGQTAPVLGPSEITITATKDVKDTSAYSEKGSLIIPMTNPNQLFFRPAVVAGQFIKPGNFSTGEVADTTLFMPKAPYSSMMYEIPKNLLVKIPVQVSEPSLVKVTTYLKKYSVKADYTITLVFKKPGEVNEREVKFKGTWNGIIHTTSKAKADKIVVIPIEEYRRSLLKREDN